MTPVGDVLPMGVGHASHLSRTEVVPFLGVDGLGVFCVSSRRRLVVHSDTAVAETWEQMETAAEDCQPEQASQREETAGQLRAAMDGLSPAQRRVLLLRFYGELDFADIAAQLECPLGTVLSHCHRGLKALRSRLTGQVSSHE